MTINEAIIHAEAVADRCAVTDGNIKCEMEHRQLAAWLRELQERRKAPKIVRCGECEYYERSDLSEYCNNPETYAIKTDSEFGCILGKRRTDK